MGKFGLTLIAALSLVLNFVAGPCFAEQQNVAVPSAKPAAAAALVLIPGAITGIGSHGPIGLRRLCSPLSVGLYQWQARFIERLLKPSEAQRSLLNGLSSASERATEAIASSCLKEAIGTTTVQLAVMERRLTGLLDALKAIRPAYGSFYASLDSHQKAVLEALGPGRRGWRW